MIPGLFASLCTPFTSTGEVDLEGLGAVVRFGLESGAEGFLCTAIAGEVAELNADERRLVALTVLEEVAGRVPVIVGVARDDDEAAVSLARAAEQAGAACVLVPAPPGPQDSSPGMDLVTVLARSVGTELMVQEAPRYAEARYGISALRHLVETLPVPPHVKVEGGPSELERAREALGETIPTWGGDGGLYLLDCLRAGAVGVIPGVEIIDRLLAAYKAGSSDPRNGKAEADGDSGADEILYELLPYLVFAMQSQAQYVACAKWVLHHRGLIASTAARVQGAVLGERQSRALGRYFSLATGKGAVT
jgi:4-hydroxy-tetrahydrodipicolinate synthase